MADRDILFYPDPEAVAAEAARRIVDRIASRDRPTICLTGGSSPKRLYELLGSEPLCRQIAWDRTHWFMGDERFVPIDDPLSNMGMAKRIFLDRHASPQNVHAIPTDATEPDSAAALYQTTLQQHYGAAQFDPARPLFDVALMGLGEDGHTASLFPGAAALAETERWAVGVARAGLAPFVPRVTLTLPVFASSAELLLLVTGRTKQVIFARIQAHEPLPAARAVSNGATTWLVDDAATTAASRSRIAAAVQEIIVMGVSGSGKTTIANALSQRLGWSFLDGDTLHSAANVEKMRNGHPLTDQDRWPWLNAIADDAAKRRARGERCVIACSALKRAYRQALINDPDRIRLVYLRGSHRLFDARLKARKGHFMPPSLLESQFADLEEPSPEEHAIVIDADATVDQIVEAIVARLAR